MDIVYTLKITQIDCINPNDTVINVHWAYTGTSGSDSASFGGTTSIEFNADSQFIPYDKLTEETVASWVLGAWTEQEMNDRKNAISSKLSIINQKLPWETENTSNSEQTQVDNNATPI